MTCLQYKNNEKRRPIWVAPVIVLILLLLEIDGVTGICPLQAADKATAPSYARRERTLYWNSRVVRSVRITLLNDSGNETYDRIPSNTNADPHGTDAARDQNFDQDTDIDDFIQKQEYRNSNNDIINVTFNGKVSHFAFPFSSEESYTANLMLPPIDSHLCEYPANVSSRFSNATMKERNGDDDKVPEIALLISSGLCSREQKAIVATQLQSAFSNLYQIKYLVMDTNFYSYANEVPNPQADPKNTSKDIQYDHEDMENSTNTNNTNQDYQDTSSESNQGNRFPAELGTFKMISVSASDVSEMRLLISSVSLATHASPHFLSAGSEHWNLQMVVESKDFEVVSHGKYDSFHDDDDKEEGDGDAAKHRYALINNFNLICSIWFGMFFVMLFARTTHLWYAGGGRIRFAYDERGRIAGLRYVPPNSNWFWTMGARVNGSGTKTEEVRYLTEEQVMALPHIIYQPDPNGSMEKDTSVDVMVDVSPFPKKEEQGESSSDKSTEQSCDGDEEKGQDNCDAADGDDDDDDALATRRWQWLSFWRKHQPPHLSQEASTTTTGNVATQMSTTCEMCSICLVDFEPGEKICLLPRCRHAFHTECILPWLTERQDSCPLCKVSVLVRPPEKPTSS